MQQVMAIRYALNKNKYLLEPEIDHLESLLDRTPPFGKADGTTERDVLMLWVALLTGARATEVLNLLKSDLNTFDKSIFLRGIKGSNDREIPLPTSRFDRLYRYARNCDVGLETQTRLFPIGYHRLRQIWDFYRPVDKKFHCLRHTFAIRLYRKTKDLRLVQVALGHRSISNTMIYADYVYSQQELRKLIL